MTALPTQDIQRITRDDAAEVASRAYSQLLDLLERLDVAAWSTPTDCDGWDVGDMVGHLIGAAKGNASRREMMRQGIHGKRRAKAFDGNALDALNDLQVKDHAHLSPAERIAALGEVAPRAIRGRVRTGGLLRRVPVPLDTGGSSMNGLPGSIPLGHLMDVIYTRDVWLHTVDIEQATGVAADRSGDLDRIVVHDAVAEWLGRHGRAVRLELTGPGGGTFVQGTDGPGIEMDAIAWARTVSGRLPGQGLLAVPVLF